MRASVRPRARTATSSSPGASARRSALGLVASPRRARDTRGVRRRSRRGARLQGVHADGDAARGLSSRDPRRDVATRGRRAAFHRDCGLVPATHGAHARGDDARTRARRIRPAAGRPAPLGGGLDGAAVGPLSGAGRVQAVGRPRRARLKPRPEATPRGAATIAGMRRSVVLFDLDGTLIDSGPIILASMRHASMTVLGREPDEELVRAAIGGPGLVAQMRDLDPDRVDELVEVYRAHNEPLHDTLETFPGVLALLPVLRDEGRRLGIVTAKRLRTVGLALDRFPVLGELMDVVIGAEDTERHKPDPDPVLEALRRLDASPEDAAYVGDSPFDIHAGNAAGVRTVAVGWGGIHPDERLAHARPDALVHTAEELHAAL